MKHGFLIAFALLASLNAQSVDKPLPATPTQQPRSDYVLGPGDQMNVWMMGIDEPQTRAVSVDPGGYVDLPMAGPVKAAGLTLAELRVRINEELKRYIRDPQSSITITEYRSQPVSVLGAVKDAGVRQLQGGRRLLEVLSLAGGLAPDAGEWILLTREHSSGSLPVAGATTDEKTGSVSGQINVAELMSGHRPDLNIEIMPHDVISVTRARMVYVLGEVGKPGAFVLNERSGVSVLQALSMAGGFTRTASPGHTRILRSVPGSTDRQDQSINLRDILEGKKADITLHADDILFVPDSLAKNASLRAIEAGIQVGTGLVIWR